MILRCMQSTADEVASVYEPQVNSELHQIQMRFTKYYSSVPTDFLQSTLVV
jgi:hypothetical protein